MSKESPTKEWQGHRFGKEYSANHGWDVGKGISDTPDHKILEQRRVLTKGRLLCLWQIVSLVDQLRWQMEHYAHVSMFQRPQNCHSQRKGRMFSTVLSVCTRPACMNSCGMRNRTNATQSTRLIAPRIMINAGNDHTSSHPKSSNMPLVEQHHFKYLDVSQR